MYSISGFTTRPTVDADYLLKNHSNEETAIEEMVRVILEEKSVNEVVTIEIRNIEKISEFKEYHGMRVNLVGMIGKTRTPFSIDIGIGDVIIPSAVERTLPVLLEDFNHPTIMTYSLESTVSEKFDAIINLMEATGRMKDFYDIYYLANSFEFEGAKLQYAVKATLSTRETSYKKDSVTVIKRLIEDTAINNRWKNFCKKILKYELDFERVVDLLVEFIDPPFQALIEGEEFSSIWNPVEKQYQ
ncbi:Nucleotidyl transferase AbiEii toxin, Type IV TA system [Dethiosulfatibacter aminovorans DSM 17477]|uniref:Nucleotidyl transferase AbiEii toxin, Type IV TA system n=1 Tax=Dethiosulfatibacter aminovorans DSM 17477 TaxID=1121476 RepID=A0A1M6IGN5_9FIRM|nr:Nucleotidyl transferase AbiEii toxin, Type IV TA system [Dethiosulfatibacter aminovorans DSM 17477]